MSTTSMPLVTVGVPAYNGERFLSAALASIAAQTYPNIEILISDNASTDATEEIARAFAARDARVKYLRKPKNVGAFANYQSVLTLGRGEYFAWLASDDLFEPRFLEACVAELERTPDAIACVPTISMFDETAGTETLVPFEYLTAERWPTERARFFTFPEFQHLFNYALFRTDALRSVRFPHAAIWKGLVYRAEEPFLSRLATRGRFITVAEPLMRYRRHAGSQATSSGAKMLRRDFHVINALMLAEKLGIAAMAPLPLPERAALARALLADVSNRYGSQVRRWFGKAASAT